MLDFSFKYDGKKYGSKDLQKIKSIPGAETYALGPLVITRETKEFGAGARYGLLRFENTGRENSGVVSDIFDIDHGFELDCGDFLPPPYCGHNGDDTKIFYTLGSDWVRDEFELKWERIHAYGNRYTNTGGRSSQGKAPFFEVWNEKQRKGVLLAVGWTGQWVAKFDQSGTAVNVSAGIENTAFYLLPGERVRTASVLAVEFEGSRNDAHNRFRRIIKERFSLPGKRGQEAARLGLVMWGGAKTDFLKEQIVKSARADLGFEYFWVDAAWYGDYTNYCANAFAPDWVYCCGDWTVNKNLHGGELRDVFKLAEQNGMKPMLWLEPERAYKTAKIIQDKPELFLRLGEHPYCLLNLADEKAQNWMIDTISHFVEDLNLKCYRQDFNFDPLEYWNAHDEENRKGITQIKHITGLYRVWDTLLEKYPDLIIDNCASGGRRLDLETLGRSVIFWRSDVNCHTDFNANHAQNNNVGLSRWLPYHGNGIGPFVTDKYRVRSCHGAALCTDFLATEEHAALSADYDLAEVRALIDEYKSVREFYACDYYPVFGAPVD
ncbi:MAG: alpha-galactosidase, partial [Firmicutes bacterium]|nr:alpha-galactosidase [Bacillota bacterium]